MTTQALVPGSLSQVAKHTNQTLAESFLSAEAVILVDVSGSMATKDSRGGRSRFDQASDELAKLQANLPGKLAVVAFSDDAVFCPAGVPIYQGGGTYLAKALRFVQPADGTVRFIVVSDGWPSDEEETLRVAATFTSEISCIYCGAVDDSQGPSFLRRLAKAHRGRFVVADRAQELASKVGTLLLQGR